MIYEQEMYYVDTYLNESKQTGKPYRMYIFIGEDKRPLEVMSKDVNLNYNGELFDLVTCTFDLQTGRYMQLKLLDIK